MEPAANTSEQASARADSDFADLNSEAQELHGRANSFFERIRDHLEAGERTDLRDRINTIYGRVQDQANRGSAPEMRRIITDLRAMIQDLHSRERELNASR